MMKQGGESLPTPTRTNGGIAVGGPSRRGFDLGRTVAMRLHSDERFRDRFPTQADGARVFVYVAPQSRVGTLARQMRETGLPITVLVAGGKRVTAMRIETVPPGEPMAADDVIILHPRIMVKNM